jgi:hypothetical protein
LTNNDRTAGFGDSPLRRGSRHRETFRLSRRMLTPFTRAAAQTSGSCGYRPGPFPY